MHRYGPGGDIVTATCMQQQRPELMHRYGPGGDIVTATCMQRQRPELMHRYGPGGDIVTATCMQLSKISRCLGNWKYVSSTGTPFHFLLQNFQAAHNRSGVIVANKCACV